jgi:hypothetical protein
VPHTSRGIRDLVPPMYSALKARRAPPVERASDPFGGGGGELEPGMALGHELWGYVAGISLQMDT